MQRLAGRTLTSVRKRCMSSEHPPGRELGRCRCPWALIIHHASKSVERSPKPFHKTVIDGFGPLARQCLRVSLHDPLSPATCHLITPILTLQDILITMHCDTQFLGFASTPPLHHPASAHTNSLNLILHVTSNTKNLNPTAPSPELPEPRRPGLLAPLATSPCALLQALPFPDLSRLEEQTRW